MGGVECGAWRFSNGTETRSWESAEFPDTGEDPVLDDNEWDVELRSTSAQNSWALAASSLLTCNTHSWKGVGLPTRSRPPYVALRSSRRWPSDMAS